MEGAFPVNRGSRNVHPQGQLGRLAVWILQREPLALMQA